MSETDQSLTIPDDVAQRVLEARPFGDATIGKYLGLETNFHSIAIIKTVLTAAFQREAGMPSPTPPHRR